MRTYPIVVFTGLFVALPAFAQQPAAPAAPGANQPAAGASDSDKVKLEEEQKSAAPAEAAAPAAPSPAMQANGQASATASASTTAAPATGVVAMAGAASAAPKEESTASPSQRGSDLAAADNTWKFEYHGYLRAPMRVGMGKRTPRAGVDQSATTLHYPLVPDDQYLSWQSTSHNKKDWAEMFFTYGNSWAKGTLALQGFNFTDAAWTDSPAQFGISQGFVQLTPDLGYENFRLEAKVGAFWARYGMAGKWDAGEYDTYLFGRTHVMGEAIRIDYDIDDANTLWFEHGIGTKRPDPSQFNNARFTLLNHAHAGLKLGSDIEFSAHYMAAWAQEEDRIIRKVNQPSAPGALQPDTYNPPNYPSSVMGVPDGKMWIAGLDARLELGAFGYFYAGYSHIGGTNSISVAPAVEVLHAFGGGQFQLGISDNYFGPSCRADTTDPTNVKVSPGYSYVQGGLTDCSMGTGKIDTLLAQYEFSLTNFRQISSGGQKFWGEGSDLKLVLYGMYNKISSDVSYKSSTTGKSVYDGIHKLKYGADLQFAALPWLTIAARYDRLQPNSNIPEQSFAILSPRLVFKSKWVTREQLSFQYSYYMYNQRDCAAGASPAYQVSPSDTGGGLPAGHAFTDAQLYCAQPATAVPSTEGFGSHYENQNSGLRGAPATRPDKNVFKVEASMWW